MPDESLPLTDLKELGREVLANEPCSALPCNLPDHWLRRIARDLDACLPDGKAVEEHSLYMAGPLALVMHLMLGKIGQPRGEFSIEALDRYFTEYRFEVNFELISRDTDLSVEPATLSSIFEGRSAIVSRTSERKQE